MALLALIVMILFTLPSQSYASQLATHNNNFSPENKLRCTKRKYHHLRRTEPLPRLQTAAIMTNGSSSSSSSSQDPSSGQRSSSGFQVSSQMGMVIVMGMIGASAGFTMYTKRTGQLLRQFEHISQQQLKRTPTRPIGPMTKPEWEKTRTRFEKDDFF